MIEWKVTNKKNAQTVVPISTKDETVSNNVISDDVVHNEVVKQSYNEEMIKQVNQNIESIKEYFDQVLGEINELKTQMQQDYAANSLVSDTKLQQITDKITNLHTEISSSQLNINELKQTVSEEIKKAMDALSKTNYEVDVDKVVTKIAEKTTPIFEKEIKKSLPNIGTELKSTVKVAVNENCNVTGIKNTLLNETSEIQEKQDNNAKLKLSMLIFMFVSMISAFFMATGYVFGYVSLPLVKAALAFIIMSIILIIGGGLAYYFLRDEYWEDKFFLAYCIVCGVFDFIAFVLSCCVLTHS